MAAALVSVGVDRERKARAVEEWKVEKKEAVKVERTVIGTRRSFSSCVASLKGVLLSDTRR